MQTQENSKNLILGLLGPNLGRQIFILWNLKEN